LPSSALDIENIASTRAAAVPAILAIEAAGVAALAIGPVVAAEALADRKVENCP